MTTTYTSQPASAASRTSGIASQAVNNACHFAGSEIDNATNKDAFLDLVVSVTFGTNPTAGNPFKAFILYAIDGTNYEDGIPSTNDGTAAASPTPNPEALVNSHGVLASTSSQKYTIRGIPLLPYKFKIVLNNAGGQNATATVLAYGRKEETIG